MARQETVSEGHRWPPRKGEVFFDRGGPFITRHNYVRRLHAASVHATGAGPLPGAYEYAFTKGAVPSNNMWSSTLLPTTLDTQLTAEGTKALNEMRPTAPLSGFGVTLGELREGIPRVIGAGLLKEALRDAKNDPRRFAKKGSEEYLNWEFGWKPLYNDLVDASRAVSNSEKILAQLYRDSGRDVRRRFGFPVTKETTSTSQTGIYPYLPGNGYLWDAPGQLITTTENLRVVWVSGMCRYYIPPESDNSQRIRRSAQEANRLLGLRPDPELLWELAPWSWLVDWVSSTGSLLGNLSSYLFDGLVWKYAYLMEHQIERKHYALIGLRDCYGTSPRCSGIGIRESKRRVSATPFGFGLSLDSFTLRQWSILAALGISRGNI